MEAQSAVHQRRPLLRGHSLQDQHEAKLGGLHANRHHEVSDVGPLLGSAHRVLAHFTHDLQVIAVSVQQHVHVWNLRR